MEFLPDLPTFAAFTLASLVLIFTPGPDMTLFVSKALAQGPRAGLLTALGTSTGLVVHTLFAALGLSVLLAHSPAAFTALKIVGALYLLWLAVETIRHGSALSVEAVARPPEPAGALWAKGVLVNLLNPKVVLFYVTFLPQFVSPTDAHAAAKLFTLGFWNILLGVPCATAMVFGAARLAATLKAHPKVMRGFDWACATLFGSFAVKLALARA